MRIGFAKMGRTIHLTSNTWGIVGGDQEPIILLRKLAVRYPQHEFVIVGRNSGERPEDIKLPSNVSNPWIDIRRGVEPPRNVRNSQDAREFSDKLYGNFKGHTVGLDAFIIFLGQHGTSNTPIPKVGSSWGDPMDMHTKPQTSFLNYCSYLVRSLNDWGDRTDGAVEPILICTDARNNVKCRDLKWPLRHPILALYEQTLSTKHERWRDERDPIALNFPSSTWVPDDPGVWYNYTKYVYSGIEIASILPWAEKNEPNLNTYDQRKPFGMIVNEARAYVEEDRLSIVKDWVMPIGPAFIHGEWSEEAMEKLGVKIEPVSHRHSFDRLATVRMTLTTPSSGSGWATRKPWESFASGVVCFFHPSYDTQGHIVPTLDQLHRGNYSTEVETLVRWLRCSGVNDFHQKVRAVNNSRELWSTLVNLQYQLFKAAVRAQKFMGLVDERLSHVEETWAALRNDRGTARAV